MKKIVIFSILVAVALWALVYVSAEKNKKLKEEQKVTVVESQAASSLSGTLPQSSSASSVPDYKLRVLSEPEGAAVYVGDEKVGVAPMEITVPADSQKLRLSLEGYDDYERQVPAAKDSEGDLVWKIQLKKAAPKEKVDFYTKEIAPFSVQIKAVPLADFYESPKNYEGIAIKFCRVKIKEDFWVRVLMGPYSNKKKASEALKKIKKQHPDAFLSTKHKCLTDGEVL